MSRGYGSSRSRRVAALAGLSAGAVLAASLPSSQAVASGEAVSASSSGFPRLQRAMDALVDRPAGPPGMVVIVHRGGDRRVLTAGVADVETGRAIRARDHMRVASVAKAFRGPRAHPLLGPGQPLT